MNPDDLVETFVSKLVDHGVPVQAQDNLELFARLEQQLSKRMPQSFEHFLSHYSFPAFDVGGITLFAWGPAVEASEFFGATSRANGSLSELLVPAGLFQVGRPDTGSFDAICFDLNDKAPNREHRLVCADHEQILCNNRVRITREVWPSFRKLAENTVESDGSSIYYECLEE
ncbi:hypothetical protein Acid345_3075 [Candidatus Koribacter versatilis Ellin345]|uniref:Knr4/Smi1-like domain-containing protein n=1 Tax=Koribacter versatilis (strain Ellin345) TaxID=204669 RepID=Q1IM24_KORVE|nr:hypothetical protein [Candidatus Koribacter versatilis]ABF42076.1 hypothetical protein Acid345_3075 [Candidatus Koribacter versatilis Ellin345]